jgi:hypothetical protein
MPPLTREEETQLMLEREFEGDATSQVRSQDNLAETQAMVDSIESGKFNSYEGDERTQEVLAEREPMLLRERAERDARQIAAGAARGVGAAISLPTRAVSLAADPATALPRINSAFGGEVVPDEDLSPFARLLRGTADAVDKEAANASAILMDDQIKMSTEEKALGFGSEALAAGVTLGSVVRGGVKGLAKGGAKLGRLAKTIESESMPVFLGTELAAAGGETAARIIAEGGGPVVEGLSMLAGSVGATTAFPALGRAAKHILKKFSLKLNSVTDQDAMILADFIEELESAGGIKRVIDDPEKHEIVLRAAEQLQRSFGRQSDIDAALVHMRNFEDKAKALNMTLEDFTMSVITGNRGAASVERTLIANNPHLAQWVYLLHAKGSKKVRDALIEAGGPTSSSRVDASAFSARMEARRRIAALDEPLDTAQARANQELGTERFDPEDLGTVKGRQGDLSEGYAAQLDELYRVMKEEVVDPKYDKAREFLDQIPGLGMSTKHSKAAYAEEVKRLGTMGKKLAPNEWLDVIDGWSAKGEGLVELLDAERTLGRLVRKLSTGAEPDHVAARQLEMVRQGVLKDLKKFEFTDLREVKPEAGRRSFDAGGPSEDTSLGILDDAKAADRVAAKKAATLAEDQRIAKVLEEKGDSASFNELRRRDNTPEADKALDALESGAPINTPGTPGQRRPIISEDTTEGLLDSRSREMANGLMDEANAAYKAMGDEFLDPPVTGELVGALRRKNPAPFAGYFHEYLNPHAGKKAYRRNVKDLVTRAGKSVETMEAAEQYLIADAYVASTREIKRSGENVVGIDRKALERWMKTNHEAMTAFPRVRDKLKAGRDWIAEAEALGARPGADTAYEAVEAFKTYAKDPEKFFDSIAGMGETRGVRRLNTVLKAMKRDGDTQALRGMKEAFWNHKVIRGASRKGAATGEPRALLSNMDEILGNPIHRASIEALYGPDHVRLLEKASGVQKGLDQYLSDMTTNPEDLLGIAEKFERLISRSGSMAVIMGWPRRIAKMGRALAEFARSLDARKIKAVKDIAAKDPGLLRDLLVMNPSEKVIRRIRNRLAMSAPTIFERVDNAAEKKEEKAAQEKTAESERRAQIPNRGMLATPNSSQGALGRFNY